MRKYRRVKHNETSVLQAYQVILIACRLSLVFLLLSIFISYFVSTLGLFTSVVNFFYLLIKLFVFTTCTSFTLFIIFNKQRELVSTFEVPGMSASAKKIAKRILRLFNDKQVTDVLKLSNTTRYGDELPLLYVWIDADCSNGYIAIENIGNFERMDRAKYEQKLSGILSGKMKRFAVTSSELTQGDTYMLFYIEDTLTSDRLYVKNRPGALEDFMHADMHAIRISKSLTIHFDDVPHLSIIARTRSGKSVFAGRYLARLMKLQEWDVYYNSPKLDRFVKEFDGEHEPRKIVEDTEALVELMKERLKVIEEEGQEKYLDMVGMNDIAVFYDELANLNAELEIDKALKKRWETAINKLTSSGASAGIHVIAISQFATKEAFLPSTARVNCSDSVIMLGGAADSGDERRYLMPGFADMPKRSYGKGQGLARILASGKKWETPHYFETPWFDDYRH